MSNSNVPNDTILFHYTFSPFAKRVLWYLNLRGIPYAQCLQPVTLPRPDLSELGINYRRIPLLSIGRDVYCDTRLILHKLDKQFADSKYEALSFPETKGLEKLLEKFTVDAGVFGIACGALPLDLPALNDPKFIEDRKTFMKASFAREDREKMQPEALAHMRNCFDLLESMLHDGRDWLAGTKKISAADIQGGWVFVWIGPLLPKEQFSDSEYPKTYAWMKRFNETVKEAEKSNASNVVELDGAAAIKHIQTSKHNPQDPSKIDSADPLGLKEGTEVEVSPVDSGTSFKDKGRLASLNKDEVAIDLDSESGDQAIRLHAPRWGFRIRTTAQL